eukprot:bmy_03097T0
MDAANFEQFLQERMKVHGKAENLRGGVITTERSKSKITELWYLTAIIILSDLVTHTQKENEEVLKEGRTILKANAFKSYKSVPIEETCQWESKSLLSKLPLLECPSSDLCAPVRFLYDSSLSFNPIISLMGPDILGGPYSRHTPMSTEALPESVVSSQGKDVAPSKKEVKPSLTLSTIYLGIKVTLKEVRNRKEIQKRGTIQKKFLAMRSYNLGKRDRSRGSSPDLRPRVHPARAVRSERNSPPALLPVGAPGAFPPRPSACTLPAGGFHRRTGETASRGNSRDVRTALPPPAIAPGSGPAPPELPNSSATRAQRGPRRQSLVRTGLRTQWWVATLGPGRAPARVSWPSGGRAKFPGAARLPLRPRVAAAPRSGEAAATAAPGASRARKRREGVTGQQQPPGWEEEGAGYLQSERGLTVTSQWRGQPIAAGRPNQAL